MFSFIFGSKLKKLEKKYARKMEEAMFAQRNGNIALYAELSSIADKLLQEIKEEKDAETSK